MNFTAALFLLQDAALAGAVYALLALALVLVFSVTRVILVPVGELVAYGGLTAAALEAGRAPPTLWLLCAVRAAVALSLATRALRGRRPSAGALARAIAWQLAYPLALTALVLAAPLAALPAAVRIALALAVVGPLGPGVYRLAYEPVAGASVLVLLIVSVAVHVVLEALGLLMFGPEGARTQPLSDARLDLGPVPVSAHAVAVVLLSAALVAALFVLAERTLAGKALRASAMSRIGARLVGIPVAVTGRWSFALAALLAALAGVLLAPVTTLHHDTGFLVGLKGFVGAVVGGMASYPLAAAGALLVGVVEAAASFWASAYKDAIVMALVVPVLAWRSLRARRVEGEE